MARFFIIAGIAWYLKPLIGTLSDYFPIFGTRRYSYILGGSAALALLWTALGLGPRTPGLMLGATLLLTTVLAICHATVSALVVEGGRMFAATGRLSTVRRVAEHVAAVAAGPVGGLLAMYSFGVTGVACGALALCLVAVVMLFPPAEDLEPPRKSWAELRKGLGVLLAARPMWCSSTLFFLLSFSPGFQTPLFYYQTNMLGFSPRFIGTLTLLGSAMSIAGSVPYPWLSRRAGLRPLMIVSVVLDALIHAMYAFYESPATAVIISSVAGLIRGFVWMPILDLLARAVPRGHEAVGSALEWTPANVAVAISDLAGSWLYQSFGLSFRSLAWLNGGSTLLILLIMPLLPESLMAIREGNAGAQSSAGRGEPLEPAAAP